MCSEPKVLDTLQTMSNKNLALEDTTDTTHQKLSYNICETYSHTNRSTCSEKLKQRKDVKKTFAKDEQGTSANTFHYKCILRNRDVTEAVAGLL